jgi:hypothetical protein
MLRKEGEELSHKLGTCEGDLKRTQEKVQQLTQSFAKATDELKYYC